MALTLTLAVLMAILGGQIAIMTTDFLQGQFMTIVMLLILAILFSQMSWSNVLEGLRAAPEGQSMINPFKQGSIPDFNLSFFLIAAFMSIYGFRAWQGSQGYSASAKSAHEAKMAGILGEFRGMITTLVLFLIPIFIFAYLHLPQYAEQAAQTQTILTDLGDAQLVEQMRVPVALGLVLPAGVMGLFAAVIVFAGISTDNTYLHSWGSIFIQDVVMPFRNRPLGARAHMWLLRASIIFVAVFAFFWSLYFPLNDYILMYFQLTGAIFLGGAGSVILGGMYWKHGSIGGAWAGMITGAVTAVTGILLRNLIWPVWLPGWKAEYVDLELLHTLPDDFPLNGVQMAFISALCAIFAYVLASLLSKSPPADMEKLLHRGKYAIRGEHPGGEPTLIPAADPLAIKPARTWEQRLGIGPEFTRGDRAIYYFKLGWSLFFIIIFIGGTVAGLIYPIPDSIWESWWGFKVGVTIVVGVITVVWFLWGGFKDLAEMILVLRTTIRDASDDGTVPPDEHVQKSASDC